MKPMTNIRSFHLPLKRSFLLIASGICGLAMSSQAGLVAHYTFDEAAGATIAINSVAGATAGVIGGNITTGVAGVSGNAYSFLGATATQDDCVDMGNASFLSDFTASGQLSYSAWVKTTDTTGGRNTVVFAGDDTSSQSYTDMGYTGTATGDEGEATARNRPNLGGGGAQQTGIFSTGIVVNDGNWHNIVMTVNLSSSLLSLYVDGAFANSQTMGTSAFPNFDNFEIGRLGRSSPTDSYTGLVDDIQIYDTALSVGDVQYIYNNPGVAVVPEPSTLALFGLSGMVAIGVIRRKR